MENINKYWKTWLKNFLHYNFEMFLQIWIIDNRLFRNFKNSKKDYLSVLILKYKNRVNWKRIDMLRILYWQFQIFYIGEFCVCDNHSNKYSSEIAYNRIDNLGGRGHSQWKAFINYKRSVCCPVFQYRFRSTSSKCKLLRNQALFYYW